MAELHDSIYIASARVNEGGRADHLWLAAGENGVEVGEGVALDQAMGFFSGAEFADGAHFA